MSHDLSPANPGAPDGAMYGCAAKGVPCVTGSPATVAPRIWATPTGTSGTTGGGAGAGRDNSDETHLVGNDDELLSEVGRKNDCVRCTSGGDIRIADGGKEGERAGPGSDQFECLDGCLEVRWS